MSWFAQLPIARKFAMALSAMCLVVLLVGGVATYSASSSVENARRLQQGATRFADDFNQMTTLTGEIRLDIVQVQQWLTDISATRGLGGLDDGWEKADQYAKSFDRHSLQLRALAVKLQQSNIITDIDSLRAQFPRYFAAGKNMARSYVQDGPEAGNRMMPQFDADAEALDGKLQPVMAHVKAIVADQKLILQKNVADQVRAASLILYLAIAALICVVLVAFFGLRVLQSTIAKPLNHLSDVIATVGIADQDNVPYEDRPDEIGTIARSFKIYHQRIVESQLEIEQHTAKIKLQAQEISAQAGKELNLQQQQVADSQAAQEQRKQLVASLADRLNSDVGCVAVDLAGAADQTRSAAAAMAGSAKIARKTATEAQHQTAQTAAATQQVATASAQLASSFSEIQQQMQMAADGASEASQEAENVDRQVGALTMAATRVGDIVKLIDAIASKTNLLALNATIEAARAGDAGRGFAVVANEVKLLAGQTSMATAEISVQIVAIQDAVENVVGAISHVNTSIRQVSDVSLSIAAGMEEFHATAAEISRSTVVLARAAEALSTVVDDVSTHATSSDHAATEFLTQSGTLQQRAGTLTSAMERFSSAVRAA